jgi:hypothetical protein
VDDIRPALRQQLETFFERRADEVREAHCEARIFKQRFRVPQVLQVLPLQRRVRQWGRNGHAA